MVEPILMGWIYLQDGLGQRVENVSLNSFISAFYVCTDNCLIVFKITHLFHLSIINQVFKCGVDIC